MKEKARDSVYKALWRGGFKIQGDAKLSVPVDTSLLQSRIVVEGNFAELYVRIGTNLQYAGWVESGTRPHWPPLRPIAEWAIRKGIPREVIGKIWYSIAWHGTKPHPYLIPAFENNIDAIREDLVASIAKEI
jgi:hypothetical protein